MDNVTELRRLQAKAIERENTKGYDRVLGAVIDDAEAELCGGRFSPDPEDLDSLINRFHACGIR